MDKIPFCCKPVFDWLDTDYNTPWLLVGITVAVLVPSIWEFIRR